MLNRKTALITGASNGIGYEISKLFAQDGYNLVLIARSGSKLEEVSKELEDKYNIFAKIIVKDLSAPGAAEEIKDELGTEGIMIDTLVNNAGFGLYGRFLEIEKDEELNMLQLNITALYQLTKIFAPLMAANGGGRILNVSSLAAFQPGPLMAAYYASKAFVLHFSEALSNELKENNIIVTALCPGPVETNFFKRAGLAGPFKMIKTMQAAEAARAGYDALKEGETVTIPGIQNKLSAFSTRLFPRKLVARVARAIQEAKEH